METREKMIVSDLQVHIIRDHEFFGKDGAVSRIDPAFACRFLGLKPDVDYSRHLRIQKIWSLCRIESPCPHAHRDALEQESSQSYLLDKNTTAYMMHTPNIEPDRKIFDKEMIGFEEEEMVFEFEDTPMPSMKKSIAGEMGIKNDVLSPSVD